jgi:hydrogenase nickel incorporation protein HypA/HybF
MHELSIAVDLVELASAEAQRLGDVRVQAVRLRIGPLSGVVNEALVFSFDLAAAGTAVEGARLEIEAEAVLIWCSNCAQSRALTNLQHRRCPVCQQPTPILLSGDGLELIALEVVDHAPSDR